MVVPESSPRQSDIISGSDPAGQTQTRIRMRIPKQHQQEPIISNLVAQHGLTVNISAALMTANRHEDGWFDLELRGTPASIEQGLNYLREMGLEIWDDASTEGDRW
ncbi:MAG TPA: NIL domain-containing protein [Elainellaceae cyanobacterium]